MSRLYWQPSVVISPLLFCRSGLSHQVICIWAHINTHIMQHNLHMQILSGGGGINHREPQVSQEHIAIGWLLIATGSDHIGGLGLGTRQQLHCFCNFMNITHVLQIKFDRNRAMQEWPVCQGILPCTWANQYMYTEVCRLVVQIKEILKGG